LTSSPSTSQVSQRGNDRSKSCTDGPNAQPLLSDGSRRSHNAKILEGMQSRVQEIQLVTKRLPPSAGMKQAIDDGMQESRQVAV
jgi:hypothetical protein